MRYLRFSLVALSMVALSAIPSAAQSICDGTAGNLVLNCGFETGDFTSWTLTGNTGFTDVINSGSFVNSGTFGAELGPVGSDGFLSQVVGDGSTSYFVSFYLGLPADGTPNDFTVLWNGTDVGPFLVDANSFPYEQFSGILGTTSAWNTLTFQYRNDPNDWALDDVVVIGQNPNTVPEPATWSLLAGGLLAAAGFARRKRK